MLTLHALKKLSRADVSFCLLLAMPLLYIPGNSLMASGLRLGLLLGVTLLLWCQAGIVQQTLLKLKRLSAINSLALVLFISGIAISSIVTTTPFQTLFVGFAKEYQGILAWILYTLIGIQFIGYNYRKSPHWLFATIVNLVIGISLLVDSVRILHGERLSGLLLQATVMGIYGVIGLFANGLLIRNLHGKKQVLLWYYLGFILSMSAVLLSQSRIAFYAAIAVAVYFAITATKKQFTFSITILSICLTSCIVVGIFSGFFSRLDGDSILKGVTYRSHVYQSALYGLDADSLLHGYGASTLPYGLNNRSIVPEDILKTLKDGYVFLSAHDIFLDIQLYFGIFSLAGFMILAISSAIRAIATLSQRDENKLLAGILIISLLNGIVNTPSLEMTSILFATLFMFSVPLQPTKKSLQRGWAPL